MESVQGDVLEAVAVSEMVVAISYLTLKWAARWNVVNVSVLHCCACGFVTEVPGFQMVEPGNSAVSVDHVENFICLWALQEDDTDPSSSLGYVCGWIVAPSNAARSRCRCVESLFCLVDQSCGLVEFVGGHKSVLRTDGLVAVVIKRARTILGMRGSELIEYLFERSHTGQQVTEHAIQILRILERACGVREPAQCLGCFTGISAGIIERGHGDLPTIEVRT